MRSDAPAGASSSEPGAYPDRQPAGSPGRPPSPRTAAGRVGPVLRVLDTLTGLFAAGMLVMGAGLLIAQLLAPALLSAAGWGAATGPGWARVLAHLGVGLAGEVVARTRHRWAGPVRAAADLVIVGVAVAVIAWAWWP